MKRSYCVFLFLLIITKTSVSQNQWLWIHGDQSVNNSGVYGSAGTGAPANIPGSRLGAATWTDDDGNFWLFGGRGAAEGNTPGLLNDLWKYNSSEKQWTWISGNKSINSHGSYGSRGDAGSANLPGARENAVSWTDNRGNFWIFGGEGFAASGEAGLLNDLWKYSPANQQWTWISGTNEINQPGSYGTRTDLSGSNFPGGRTMATSWKDPNGNLWLFGGSGYSAAATDDGDNDGGDGGGGDGGGGDDGGDDGDDDDDDGNNGNGNGGNGNGNGGNGNGGNGNNGNGNGGNGNGNGNGNGGTLENRRNLNDIWVYSINTNRWAWMKGAKEGDALAHYGDKGDFGNNNTPGGRRGATGWTDRQGNFWLYGGAGSGLFNDLWKYNPQSNRWAWMSGSDNTDQQPVFSGIDMPDVNANPGSRMLASGWNDNNGDLWLFGGNGYGGNTGFRPLNNLWRYKLSTREWTFVKGDAENNPSPVYGTKGVAAPDNKPGGTDNAASWKDAQGDLYIFGGRSDIGLLNQLWKFSFTCGATISGNISPATASICEGAAQLLTAEGGTSYEWKRNGVTIEGQTSSTYSATQPGIYSVIIYNGIRSGPASNVVVIANSSSPSGTVSPASASICEGGSQVLTATGGTSYIWKRNKLIIAGATGATLTVTEPGTYTVTIKNGNCSGPAANIVEVKRATKPTGNITPASATICEGGTQLLTATGGTSYEWQLDGVKIEGESGATINASKTGTYSVIITNGSCQGLASNTASVNVVPGPSGSISPSAVSICAGNSQVLTATGGTSYQWKLDGSTIEGQTGSMLTVNEPGTYSVIISNGTCSIPASNNAVVSVGTDASGIRYPDVVANGNASTNLAARPIGTKYEWIPAAGLDNPASANPRVSVSSNRQYLVRITPETGCTIVDTVLIKVSDEIKIFIPTAFTPNANGVNDRLRPLGKMGTMDYFRIYNRWGNLLFQTNEQSTGWDGTYKGVVQPTDTYTWVLEGTSVDGVRIKQTGKTLLIR